MREMSAFEAERILGLESPYSIDDAKAAQRKLLAVNHPDAARRNGISAEEASANTMAINEAFKVVKSKLESPPAEASRIEVEMVPRQSQRNDVRTPNRQGAQRPTQDQGVGVGSERPSREAGTRADRSSRNDGAGADRTYARRSPDGQQQAATRTRANEGREQPYYQNDAEPYQEETISDRAEAMKEAAEQVFGAMDDGAAFTFGQVFNPDGKKPSNRFNRDGGRSSSNSGRFNGGHTSQGRTSRPDRSQQQGRSRGAEDPGRRMQRDSAQTGAGSGQPQEGSDKTGIQTSPVANVARKVFGVIIKIFKLLFGWIIELAMAFPLATAIVVLIILAIICERGI